MNRKVDNKKEGLISPKFFNNLIIGLFIINGIRYFFKDSYAFLAIGGTTYTVIVCFLFLLSLYNPKKKILFIWNIRLFFLGEPGAKIKDKTEPPEYTTDMLDLNFWLIFGLLIVPSFLMFYFFQDVRSFLNELPLANKRVVFGVLTSVFLVIYGSFFKWKETMEKNKLIKYTNFLIAYCIFNLMCVIVFEWEHFLMVAFKIFMIVVVIFDILLCLWNLMQNSESFKREENIK